MPRQVFEEVQRQGGIVEPFLALRGEAVAVVEIPHQVQGYRDSNSRSLEKFFLIKVL